MEQKEDRVFVALMIVASAAFVWVVVPFFGAILWGVVAAILFAPFNHRLLQWMPGRHNSAALMSLLAIIAIAVLPAAVLASALVQQAADLYGEIQSGSIDFEHHFNQLQSAMPHWAHRLIDQFGLGDFDTLRARLESSMAEGLRMVAGQAVQAGADALGFFVALFVMLYLTYFLLRDGREVADRIDRALPLRPDLRRALTDKFLTVVRATVKGSLIVAVVQGALGGIVFWFLGLSGALLWAVAMGFFSLLPAIGTGIVWVPVAMYLLATGLIWQGLFLVFCGLFVIGMVDNILRPILVGRDTRIPDYVVFVATLGGLDVFGFNGLIMGPLIAALFLTVWEVFIATRQE